MAVFGNGAPLSEEQVEQHTSDEIRAWARSQSSQSHRTGGGSAAAIAAAEALGGAGTSEHLQIKMRVCWHKD